MGVATLMSPINGTSTTVYAVSKARYITVANIILRIGFASEIGRNMNTDTKKIKNAPTFM